MTYVRSISQYDTRCGLRRQLNSTEQKEEASELGLAGSRRRSVTGLGVPQGETVADGQIRQL